MSEQHPYGEYIICDENGNVISRRDKIPNEDQCIGDDSDYDEFD